MILDRVYEGFASVSRIAVPAETFDDRYSETVHGFGFFPRLVRDTQVSLVRALDGLTKAKAGVASWMGFVKDLKGGYLFLGGDFEEEIRIPERGIVALSYGAFISEGGNCGDPCALHKKEWIGVLTNEGGAFTLDGPIKVARGKRFDGFISRQEKIREGVALISREIAHYSRATAVRLSEGIPKKHHASRHSPEGEELLREIAAESVPPSLDYMSLHARRA